MARLAVLAIIATVLAQVDASFTRGQTPKLTSHEEGCYYKKDLPGESKGANGRSYRGLVTFTSSGRQCAKWTNVALIGEHDPIPDVEDDAGAMVWGNGLGNHNYCRNPDGRKSKPWCFTVGGKEELCNVDECDPNPRTFLDEADALRVKMTGNTEKNCECASQLYGGGAFLESAHMGRTKDGRPCKCS